MNPHKTLSEKMNKSRDNQYLNDLIEVAPVGIVEFAPPDGRINRWNKQCERIFGWTEEEVLGKYNPILPEGFDEEYAEQRKNAFGGIGFKGQEVIRLRKDGSYVNVLIYTSFIKDESGKIIGVVTMYVDITDKKKAENRLIWNELLLRTMTENSKLGFYVVDNRNDKILFVNSRFAEIWDFFDLQLQVNECTLKNSEIIELISSRVINKEKFKTSFNLLKDFKNQTSFRDEIELEDGRFISIYTTILNDRNNNYLGRFFLFEDITDRKIFEKLLHSEEEYKQSIEESAEAIFLIDLKGKINFVNRKACETLGKNKDELLQLKIKDIFDGDGEWDLKELNIGKTLIKNIELIGNNKTDSNLEAHYKVYSPGNIQVIIFKQNLQEANKNRIHKTFTDEQGKFVFASDVMKRINFEISRVAALDFDVLLMGETGVGKDMVAAQIYLRSSRNKYAFIPVPISTLSDNLIESELFGHEKGAFSGADKMTMGKFEAADKGILYIPEISSLPESIQLKLLYFMQYKTITRVGQDARKGEIKLDVRLIMATNENLEELVRKGKIRKDFYYRMSGTKIYIPPLRERKDDIEVLADHFLKLYAKNFDGKKFVFNPEVIPAFKNYPWNGNVRELANSIRNVISFNSDSLIKLENFENILNIGPVLKTNYHDDDPTGELIDYENAEIDFKRKYFQKVLEKSNYNIGKAAKLVKLTPQGLRKLLNKLGLKIEK